MNLWREIILGHINCARKTKDLFVIDGGHHKSRPREPPSPTLSFLAHSCWHSSDFETVQRSAKIDAQGCVNDSGKLGQNWKATAVTKFTKPGAPTLADHRTTCQNVTQHHYYDAFLSFCCRLLLRHLLLAQGGPRGAECPAQRQDTARGEWVIHEQAWKLNWCIAWISSHVLLRQRFPDHSGWGQAVEAFFASSTFARAVANWYTSHWVGDILLP